MVTADLAVELLLAGMRARGAAPAVFWDGRTWSYDELMAAVAAWRVRLDADGVAAGTVVSVVSDYSPQTIALLFALMEARAILVPLTRAVAAEQDMLMALAGVTRVYRFEPGDTAILEHRAAEDSPLVARFRERGHAGLIVFTSGSTGAPKGILHDCDNVARKFLTPRDGWRTVLFLMMDHFGGFNTLLGAFAYGGVGVCVADRSPGTVSATIAAAKATLLPTTPTFLNLLAASGAYRAHDLSSVKLVTYGTEVMSEATLARIKEAFPNATFKQTYGLSEVGVLRSRSEAADSLWVRLGGDGFEVRVVDGLLWVRSEANMVGYLNAPSPFDGDGWLCTGDRVEVRGEFMRVLGRDSDIINVGGQKVFPTEVENVLLEDPNVAEASVFAAKHPLLGQVVQARLTLREPEEHGALVGRLRRRCIDRLAKYKVPVRFTVVAGEAQVTERYKKSRRDEPGKT